MFDWLTNLLGSGNSSGNNNAAGMMDGPYSAANPSGAGIAGFSPAGSGTGGGLLGGLFGSGGGTTGGTTNGATPLGLNTGTGQLAFSGLQSLGNLWNAFQSSQLANKTFNFTKNLANTNLANQTQAYNTNLEGMADARYAQENQSPAAALDFVNAHKLATKTL